MSKVTRMHVGADGDLAARRRWRRRAAGRHRTAGARRAWPQQLACGTVAGASLARGGVSAGLAGAGAVAAGLPRGEEGGRPAVVDLPLVPEHHQREAEDHPEDGAADVGHGFFFGCKGARPSG